ncbi:MAG: galactokinase family protein [Kouleothrix sp.]
MGEHTDYNDGFVLPAAIDRATYVAARPRDDTRVHIVAVDLHDEDELPSMCRLSRARLIPGATIRGVVKGLLVAWAYASGANLLITSDVPARISGLSSSAALEVTTGYAFQVLNRLNILGEELALLAQGAENSFVGVQCGIMDRIHLGAGPARPRRCCSIAAI